MLRVKRLAYVSGFKKYEKSGDFISYFFLFIFAVILITKILPSVFALDLLVLLLFMLFYFCLFLLPSQMPLVIN